VYSESSPVSLTFTHDTWQEINRIKDEHFPDLKIVGWYHSHPGLGIFLSAMDEFIHRNFFNMPWQIAYVIDPVNEESGIFRWEGGALVEVLR
jgi:proteasome lid subunit RPN8/RPN11